MVSQFVRRYPTNRMDEVSSVQVLESILIWIMSIRATVEVMSQRVFDSVLVMSILWDGQNTWNVEHQGLTQYSSSLYMKGVMA